MNKKDDTTPTNSFLTCFLRGERRKFFPFPSRTFFANYRFWRTSCCLESITAGVYAYCLREHFLVQPSYAPDTGESSGLGALFTLLRGIDLFYRSNQSAFLALPTRFGPCLCRRGNASSWQ